MSKWKSGQCCPDIQLLPEPAGYFGVSVDTLLGYDKAGEKEDGGEVLYRVMGMHERLMPLLAMLSITA